MATNIMNYGPEATPPSYSWMNGPLTPTAPTVLQSLNSPSPVGMPAAAPAPSAVGGLSEGHLKPAEIQIVVIVVIAGLFNAFFLILSLRLVWRRYHAPAQTGDPPAASAAYPDIESNLCRVTPMLVRQPDDELVYGLKQVLDQDQDQVLNQDDRPKPPVP